MSTIVLTETATEFVSQTQPSATPAISRPRSRKVAAPARPSSRRRAAARRPRRLDWETIAVVLLMLACAAVGLYRLIWMGL